MLYLWDRQRLLRHSTTWLWNSHFTGTQSGQLPVFSDVSHKQRWNRAHRTGILCLEDVSRKVLGIFPSRGLFPETVWGPAKLNSDSDHLWKPKHTHSFFLSRSLSLCLCSLGNILLNLWIASILFFLGAVNSVSEDLTMLFPPPSVFSLRIKTEE